MASDSLRVLVTGASGFVGGYLLKALESRRDIEATAAVRACANDCDSHVVAVGDIDQHTNWSPAVHDRQVVVHAAARAHIMNDEAADPLAAFRQVNVAGTLTLARQAAAAGVRRFVFISSIKVNGEQTAPGQIFKPSDPPAPEDDYGLSKLEAEQGLQEIAHETGMEVVIVRSPLIYGLGVKGNFASMIKLIEKGVPLPLGAIDNRRSLVAVGNLVDLVVTCIDHPAAANQTFLVADGEDLSTPELFRRVARAMGKPSRLIPVPESVLQLGATLIGKKAVAQRLLGSLQLDISKTQNVLGWEPPLSVDEGLQRCFLGKQDD